MPLPLDTTQILANASIARSVFDLRPDYRAILLAVTNIPPGSSSERSESLLLAAEAAAKAALAAHPAGVTTIPHVAAWREAYKAFGAKPTKTRPSIEALLRRVDVGLPRVNRLTDIYNAISIKYQIPLGGEDLDAYAGSPFLVRATGEESFDIKAGEGTLSEKPAPGEVVWCDENGVTCRRWNWRQCVRTALTDETRNVLFIFDALDPCDDKTLERAAEELGKELSSLSPEVKIEQQMIRQEHAG